MSVVIKSKNGIYSIALTTLGIASISIIGTFTDLVIWYTDSIINGILSVDMVCAIFEYIEVEAASEVGPYTSKDSLKVVDSTSFDMWRRGFIERAVLKLDELLYTKGIIPDKYKMFKIRNYFAMLSSDYEND